MQRVQNWAAKLILKRSKLSSSVEARMALHWLPIKYRIDFKLMLIVHKCLKGETPTYLSDLIQYNYRRGGLRNNTDARKLLVPYVKNKTFASRAFSVYAPRMEQLTYYCTRNWKHTGIQKSFKNISIQESIQLR